MNKIISHVFLYILLFIALGIFFWTIDLALTSKSNVTSHEVREKEQHLKWLEIKNQRLEAELKELRALEETAMKIYFLESTSGLNDPCKARNGGFNGFGYQVGTCYRSFEEVRYKVILWLQARQDWEEGTKICYYATGRILEDCEYYRKFLTL